MMRGEAILVIGNSKPRDFTCAVADRQAFAGKATPLLSLYFTFFTVYFSSEIYQIVFPLLTKIFSNIKKKGKKIISIHGMITIKV